MRETTMGGNRNEVAGERAVGSRAPASGYLCGVCDTPLLVGASTCIECGTPVTGAEGRDPATGATPPAPRPVGSPSTAAADTSPTTTGPGRTPLLVAAVVIVVALAGVFVVTRGGSDDDPAAAPTAEPTPTTEARSATTVTPAAATGAATAELCDAVELYAVADMLTLGEHIVEDPAGTLAAYETILAEAPTELRSDIETMAPLTRTAVAVVQSGQVTTTEEIQAWLVNAPREDLETWVAAQQVVAPALADTCAAA